MTRSRRTLPWRPFVAIVALAILLYLAHRLPVTRMLLDLAAARRHDPMAALYLLLIGIPYSAIGLPRQALCLAAGIMFGGPGGLALATLATLGGNVAGFLWTRHLGGARSRDALRRRFAGRLAPVGDALNHAPFQSVLILRLMPIGSALMVTMAAGLYGVPVLSFTFATLLGALPQNLVFVLIGAGARIDHTSQMLLGIALFAISSLLGIVLLKRARRQNPAFVGALGSTTDVDAKLDEKVN